MTHTAKLLIRDVICVKSADTVARAAQVMEKAGIGSVIVGTLDKPEGIFTERDVCFRVVAKGLDPAKTAVSQVMTRNPVTVDAAAPLDKVFERLADGRFRHLPITEKGKVVGIVSLTDLGKVLQEVYREDKYIQYFADVLSTR